MGRVNNDHPPLICSAATTPAADWSICLGSALALGTLGTKREVAWRLPSAHLGRPLSLMFLPGLCFPCYTYCLSFFLPRPPSLRVVFSYICILSLAVSHNHHLLANRPLSLVQVRLKNIIYSAEHLCTVKSPIRRLRQDDVLSFFLGRAT